MRVVLILSVGLLVGACGADGEPIQPTANTNISLSSKGVGVGTNVRLGKGPFAVNLGLGL